MVVDFDKPEPLLSILISMVWKNIYFKIYLDFSNIWLVIIIINDFKHHHCVIPPIFFIVSLPNSLLNFRLTFIFEIDFNIIILIPNLHAYGIDDLVGLDNCGDG